MLEKKYYDILWEARHAYQKWWQNGWQIYISKMVYELKLI